MKTKDVIAAVKQMTRQRDLIRVIRVAASKLQPRLNSPLAKRFTGK